MKQSADGDNINFGAGRPGDVENTKGISHEEGPSGQGKSLTDAAQSVEGDMNMTPPKLTQNPVVLVFQRCTFVIVTLVKMVGYVFAIIGLSCLFVALGIFAAFIILLCPWITWPAFRSGWQQGYYVPPSPQQQELQQQIVETLKPQNTQVLTEDQVNQKFPAITYKRAKELKDGLQQDNATQLEERRVDNSIVPFEATERDNTCVICLEDMEDPDPVRLLSCNHAFHAECIDTWLTVRRSCCPLCKADQYHAQTKIPENRPSTFRDTWNNMPFPSAFKIKRRRKRHRSPSAASRRRENALRRILERHFHTQSD